VPRPPSSRPELRTALALGRLLAARELDPVAVCEEALARARATTSVFTALTEKRARAEARASAARLRAGTARGPLDGVPVAWKDLIDVAGTPTSAASALRRTAAPAAADAPVVAALAAAGMVCVGKTNLSELAYSGLGLNPHHGTPPNPRSGAVPRAPGGSSSGSAVAVAQGVVPCAIGTDTSGSIRVPAAFCGVAGFKPTAARVDRGGVLALAPSLDSVGPLATSVADLAALDAALRGAPVEPLRAAAAPRLVVPDELAEAEPDVAAAFAGAVAALQDAGAVVERRPLGVLGAVRRAFDEHGSLVAHEAWRVHRALLESPDAERLDRRVLRRLRDGRALPPAGRDALLRERPALQARLAAELDGALALWPTVAHVAPELAPLERDDEHFSRTNLRSLASTMPGSYLDMPGVALPVGSGLPPASLLVSGPPGADARVLAAALAVEQAL
jgi:aspartyl-tRNA(Asn)/glutamyl-tRNA(Gln) amidotransferase subunit A